jgi:hypothetical protein
MTSANAPRDPSLLTAWLHVGRPYTLMSYGLTPSPTPGDEERRALVRELARAMPRRHLQFLSQLQLTFTCGDFFVVRPGVPVAEQQEDDRCGFVRSFCKASTRAALAERCTIGLNRLPDTSARPRSGK